MKYLFLLGGLLLSLLSSLAQEETSLPTDPFTPTSTSSATFTPTLTATVSPTPTATPTPVIIVITAPPRLITVEPLVLTAPPLVITAPPVFLNATPSQPKATAAPPPTQLTPFYGWQRYQSIHFIAVVGEWAIQSDRSASARQFRESDDSGSIARYPFIGDGVRLRYRLHPRGCRFDIVLDTQVLATLDSFSPTVEWVLSESFFLSSGYHVLDIRAHNAQSGSCSVAFDSVDVFSSPPLPIPPTPVANPANALIPLATPDNPTPTPTLTLIPAGIVTLTVQLHYDGNANQTADLREGVQGVSVRVVNATTGQLLNSGITDSTGTVRFQLVTRDSVVASIPFLAETFSLRVREGEQVTQTWSLLLPAVNLPAVIP